MKSIKSISTALIAVSLLAASLAVPSLYAQSFSFTTIAGGMQGDMDGLNTNAQFFSPTGVAADSAGNLFVADQANNLIREITPLGTNWIVTTLAGGARGGLDGTNAGAQFSGPTGITVSRSGNLYVADQYNDVIRQITVSGTNWSVTTIAGKTNVSGSQDGTNTGARFSSPTGVSEDGSGNVYVADEQNNAIRKIMPSGTNWIVTTIAGGTPGARDGTNTAAQFFDPAGVAVDSVGRVFVADQFNNTIRLITPSGTNWVVTTIAGQPLAGLSNGVGTNAYFDAPVGVAVDTNENVYVADLFNNAIRELTPLGTNWAAGTNWVVSTIGGGTMGGSNGTGTNASFDLPSGLVADAFGDVYLADSANNAIRLGISSTAPAASGALEILLTPAAAVSAGARWQVDGGTWQTNGAILAGLVPGNHTINFSAASGYTTPATQTIPVTAHRSMVSTGDYPVAIANAGSLQVMLTPAGAVAAGAQWQVDGGTWQTNAGIVAGLTVGSHALSFGPLAGWTSPSNQSVMVTNSQTTLGLGSYVLQTGSLLVNLFPSAAVSDGAKWQVDGGTYRSAGASVSGLLPGNHTVSFNTVLGWQTPASQTVTITNALMTAASGYYTVTSTQPGQLSDCVFTSGNFQFVLSGQVGSSYVSQASTDLIQWTAFATNTIPAGGSVLITDTNTGNYSQRFYRCLNH